MKFWLLFALLTWASAELCTANINIGACDPPPMLQSYLVQSDATFLDRIRFYGNFSYMNSGVAFSSCVSTGDDCPSTPDCSTGGSETWEFEDSLMPVDDFDVFHVFQYQVCNCSVAKDAGASSVIFYYDTGRYTCNDVALSNFGTCNGPQATECAGVNGCGGGGSSSVSSDLDPLLF